MLLINSNNTKNSTFRMHLFPKFKLLALPAILFIISACGGGSSSSTGSLASLSLSANPLSIAEGESTIITWQALNFVSCKADGNWTAETKPAGQVSVGPLDRTTTYTMSCLDKEGGLISESVTVIVDGTPPFPRPNLTLTASPNRINANDPSTIIWSTSNADSCVALGGWSNRTGANNSQIIRSIPSTTTYSMRCTGPGGTVSESVSVLVNDIPLAPAPTLNLTTDNPIIDVNGSTTIRWTSTNTTTCNSVGDWTEITNTNGSQQVGPLQASRDFRITCTGVGGGISKSVRITVGQNSSVETAELSWSLPITNEDGTFLDDLAGFTIHYGTTQNNLNQIITINNPSISSYVVSNLIENTYYFAVSAFDVSGNNSKNSPVVRKSAQ